MFIEQALSGKNNWSLYILTVLIVFLIMQIASLPLLIYMLITTPETLQNDMLDTVTDTNLGLVLTLLTFVAGFFALFFCRQIHPPEKLPGYRNQSSEIQLATLFLRSRSMGDINLDNPEHYNLYPRK